MASIPFHLALSGFTAAALVLSPAITAPASAQLFNSALDRLPVKERVTLREGQAIVSGEDGQFIGRVLINAPISTVWQVLTDYDNFDRFFPNVENSQLLESAGNRSVFEQVTVVQTFVINIQNRVVVATTENYPQQIRFLLVEGDVNALQGFWRLDRIETYTETQPHQVLITHQVAIDPEDRGVTRDIFFNTYKNVLEETLLAIKQETERRSGN
jgi:ribosome-associated toxin RatA of RatAB toxin-antitoxin module